MKPRIALTMGDPAGVGPEICLQAAASEVVRSICQPVIYGDYAILQRVAARSALQLPMASEVVDLPSITAAEIVPGRVNAATGRASYEYIIAAIDAAMSGEVQAVATAPIHKEALHLAGIDYPGHTEIFTQQSGAEHSCMMLTSAEITCSLVTTHVGLREVPDLLTSEAILQVIRLSHAAMRRLRQREPKLVVCGLNPHAGEHGLFGAGEEERIIAPAIEAARAEGISIEGPLPADTAFLPAIRQQTDCYVCMYHDQGLIPLKTLAFDTAVNVTLGLPIVRTSVDHGTALDIAWQGKASVVSMIEAVKLAVKLAE
jgi:4-hydroxythreonine-4-phosphate dehydrogenase